MGDSCEQQEELEFRSMKRAGFYTFLVSIGLDNLSVDEMTELFDEWMDGIFYGMDWEGEGLGFDFPMLLTMVREKGRNNQVPTFLRFYQMGRLRKFGLSKSVWYPAEENSE